MYGSVRQVSNSLVERDSQYESVVLVEHPRLEVYSIGLVTDEGIDPVDRAVETATVAVFLSNSPNPTAGRLVMVPDDQVHETEMSVRQGVRLVVTTGTGDQGRQVDQYLGDPAPVETK